MKLLLAHVEKVDRAKEEGEKETGEAKGASPGKVRVCENCGKEAATIKRRKCRLARYCSAECQLEDWNAHKVECKKAREIKRLRQELKLKQKEAEEKEAEGKMEEDENEEGENSE